jgi:aminopeptidase N
MMRLRYTVSARRPAKLIAMVVSLAAAFSAAGQVHHGCPVRDPGLSSYTNPLYDQWLSAYDVKGYCLDLAVTNSSTYIEGSAAILFETLRNMDTLVLELQDALDVSTVLVADDAGSMEFPESNRLAFTHENGALFIAMDRRRMKGELIRVQVRYSGEAGQNRGFFAGINTETDGNYGFKVTYTLSEPHNARDWFPVKQVLEDKIDSVTFRLRCDRELLAGSNGVLVDVQEERTEHVLTWKTAYPMAYYLLSFAVADYRDLSFKAFLPGAGDSVLVQNFIYDDDGVLADWEEEIRMTGPMITSYSELLGDYPFPKEKYGHSMAPMGGGMEHQTMTTIHNFNFFLVAHELAHQWFGDYVTCGNWQDIWINEGFASYMEYVCAQELLGQDAADQWMANAMTLALRETDGSVYVPEQEVEDEYRLFDYGLSYKKGAVLLHMIRFILDNDPLFFSTLRAYIAAFGNGLATAEDFRDVLEQESGMDFSCFFNQWYYGQGFPTFDIHWEQRGDSLLILSEQFVSAPQVTPLFQVPFELEVRKSDGSHERIRLMQGKAAEQYTLEMNGVVEDLIFDPDMNLLATSGVVQKWPSSTSCRYGPNPVTRDLYIQIPNVPCIETLRITSILGREVLKATDLVNPVIMDLSLLADGPYFLELTFPAGTLLERIVKVSPN